MRLHFFCFPQILMLDLVIALWQWQKRRGENQKLVLITY